MSALQLPAPYVAHLLSPHHVGDLDAAHGLGEVGSMVGGSGVRITLRYEDPHATPPTLSRLQGRVFGSCAATAPLSYVCATLEGATRDAARSWTAATILSGLRGSRADAPLPEAVVRATTLVAEALQQALTNEAPSSLGEGILVCRCLGVGDHAIRDAVRQGATTVEDIGDWCKASTGCRSCRPDVLALIEATQCAPPPQVAASRPVSERVALHYGTRLLRGLGMPLLEARLRTPSTLAVRLGPPEAGASVRAVGAVALLRHLLRETVDEGLRVVEMDEVPSEP